MKSQSRKAKKISSKQKLKNKKGQKEGNKKIIATKAEEQEEKYGHKELKNIPQITPQSIQQMKQEDKKNIIAMLSQALVSSPQSRIKNLQELLLLCKVTLTKSISVSHLALKSLCLIFTDLAPAYQIAQLTQEQQKEKVSIQVRELRKYQQTFVQKYQEYLKQLQEVSTMPQLETTSASCFAFLLKKIPHFNYRVNIALNIVNLLPHKAVRVREIATQAYFNLMRSNSESLLDIKLHMLRRLTKILQKSHTNMQPRVIDALCQQNIVINEDVIKSRNAALSKIAGLKLQLKKKKKAARGSDTKLGQMRQIKKQILNLTRESMTGGANEGNLDLNVLARLNKDIQKQILTIYFYLLKSAPNTRLLPPVFEGIPKFSKLVNIELAENIIDVIKEYLYNQCFEDSQNSGDAMKDSLESNFKNILSALHCSVRIEEQIGDAIGIEQNKQLIRVIYKIMSCFNQTPSLVDSKSVVIVIKCLQSIFLKKRAYNHKTICAIVKKLAIICCNIGSNAVIAPFLFMIRLLFNKYPQISMNMMDLNQFYGEEDPDDPFSLDVQDPDLSNAQKSVIVYELLAVKQKLLRQNQLFKKGNSNKFSQDCLKKSRNTCTLTFKILQCVIDLSQLPKETLGSSPDKLYTKLKGAEDFDNIILSLKVTE